MNNLHKYEKEIINALQEIWNYMRLNQSLEKCDLIMGCGCSNLEIPIKCAQLYKEGYAKKILFTGGLGKITKNTFNKSEAEIYKDIAIKQGVDEKDILIETKSKNTVENFKFSFNILKKNNIKAHKILIVHGLLAQKRTLSCAKAILKDQDFLITSPDTSFEEFLEKLKGNKQAIDTISTIVGNIQRLIIYPQFGWQKETEVPKNIINIYYFLKELGFSKYILSENEINNLINKYGIAKNQHKNYFN